MFPRFFQIQYLRYEMWAEVAQTRQKFRIFCYKFSSKGYVPLSNFHKIWHGKTIPGLHPQAKFYQCGFINVGVRPQKLPKIIILGINFSPKRYIPLSNFHKISHGVGVPGPQPCAKCHHCPFQNVGLKPPKSPKLVIFGINLPKRGIPS